MLIEGAIYKYPKEFGGWARHSLVYTWRDKNGVLWAINTYEGFSVIEYGYIEQYTRCYRPEDIENDVEFIMLLSDTKEVTQDEFFQYDEKDRLWIPIGMRKEIHFVNKNASPRVDYIREQLEYKIRECESTIRWNQNSIKRYQGKLAELEG